MERYGRMDSRKFYAIAKFKGLNLNEHFACQNDMFEKILKKAENKELDARTYIVIKREYSSRMEKKWIFFKDQNSLFATLRAINPQIAEDQIKHEKEHLEKIEKYGLTPVFLILADCKLDANKNLNYRPAVSISDPAEIAEVVGWDLEKMIEIEIDITTVTEESDRDDDSLKYFKTILSNIREKK